MLIAQISDTHILVPAPDRPAAALRAECLRRCIADINERQPDAVIFTGDTVQHGQPEEYEHLRELLKPLQSPLYLVPGNRDDKQVLRGVLSDFAYLSTTSEFLNYTIEDYAIRLIGLDSTLAGERKGRYCEKRQAWLNRMLSEQHDRPTLLFIHHPPFDVDTHYVGGYRHFEEATALEDIVSRNPNVVGLLCGHVHWPVERDWGGTQARIMPSVAVDLRKGIDETVARQQPIYLLHQVSAATGIVSQSRTVGAA